MNLIEGRVLGHYRLLAKLGVGGMGVVWKGLDLTLDRAVAIKFLPEEPATNPGRRTAFEREAKAVAAFHHPNIVTIYSVEEAEGFHFFTMEYVDGRPLSALVAPGGISLDRFLEIALPLADAVAAAHERGIVHRDLKPANVLLRADGAPKILDFGLARILGPAAPLGANGVTLTSEYEEGIAGTIGYMPPEQVRGEAIDHRADLFSLGALLYELATGRLPFSGESAADLIVSILQDDPRPVREFNPRLPPAADAIFRGCLEKDARDRTGSALELKRELEELRRFGGAAPSQEAPSIAVLPFTDMSRDKRQAYFCEGVAEEIINALCRVESLRVASRTSSFRFGGAAADPKEIGRRLGVGTLLEGSVRKAGRRLRVTAQLIDARQGFHLWSETFDRETRDIFAIQEEIARSVVRALRVTLSPKETGELGRVSTNHVQAYDYYLRGRSFYYRYGKHDIEFALQLFTRATELDPVYAAAFAGLADCWSYIYLYSERKESVRLQAEAASRRAVELAPESAPAQASLAVALSIRGDTKEAEEHFEKAVRIDPGLWEAWYFYARHSFVRGESAKAIRLFEEAGRVRPDDYQAPLLAAQSYDDLGKPEEASQARRRGVALVAERLQLQPDDTRALYMGANGLVALGEKERGLEWARRAGEIAPGEPMLLYNLGCIYSLAGETEPSLDSLEQAVAHGLSQKAWFEHDSNLDPVRSEPRFKALMDKLD